MRISTKKIKQTLDANQIDLTSEIDKRQFIAVPRVGRSSELAQETGGQTKIVGSSSIPINKILLNHIYYDLLKRQGYIPTPRVGRSAPSPNYLSKLLNRYPELLLKIETSSPTDLKERRFKRSPLLFAELSDSDASDADFSNNNNLINKRQFLPPPRIGKRYNQFDNSQLTKETLALSQLNSNAIDGSSADVDSLSNLGNYLQEESNQLEPIDSRTLSKLIKWINMNKNKQILANAYSEKRATYSSRLGRSAPLTPRLGRSYWGTNEPDSEAESTGNDQNDKFYDNRIIRTALTPRIGKRSLKTTGEKVM